MGHTYHDTTARDSARTQYGDCYTCKYNIMLRTKKWNQTRLTRFPDHNYTPPADAIITTRHLPNNNNNNNNIHPSSRQSVLRLTKPGFLYSAFTLAALIAVAGPPYALTLSPWPIALVSWAAEHGMALYRGGSPVYFYDLMSHFETFVGTLGTEFQAYSRELVAFTFTFTGTPMAELIAELQRVFLVYGVVLMFHHWGGWVVGVTGNVLCGC
jgi:hypothetical protein